MENASLLLIDKSTNIYPPLLHTAKPFFFFIVQALQIASCRPI